MYPLLTSIPPDVKRYMKSTMERESPEDAYLLLLLRGICGGEHRCKEFHTLAVRTINAEEKRLVRQDGISTKCGWYPAVRLVVFIVTTH